MTALRTRVDRLESASGSTGPGSIAVILHRADREPCVTVDGRVVTLEDYERDCAEPDIVVDLTRRLPGSYRPGGG